MALAGRQREFPGELPLAQPGVYGIPTGGSVVAALLANISGRPLLDAPHPGCLIVDDLVDSGATARPYVERGYRFDALYRKPHSPPELARGAAEYNGWIVFPWEHDSEPIDAARRLCQWRDPNPATLEERARRLLLLLQEQPVSLLLP